MAQSVNYILAKLQAFAFIFNKNEKKWKNPYMKKAKIDIIANTITFCDCWLEAEPRQNFGMRN